MFTKNATIYGRNYVSLIIVKNKFSRAFSNREEGLKAIKILRDEWGTPGIPRFGMLL